MLSGHGPQVTMPGRLLLHGNRPTSESGPTGGRASLREDGSSRKHVPSCKGDSEIHPLGSSEAVVEAMVRGLTRTRPSGP